MPVVVVAGGCKGTLLRRCALRRISSSGRARPDWFKLDQRLWPVCPGRCCTAVNCNPACSMAVARTHPLIGTGRVLGPSMRREGGPAAPPICGYVRGGGVSKRMSSVIWAIVVSSGLQYARLASDPDQDK